MLEVALILPILLLVIMGIIDTVGIMRAQGALSEAVRYAAAEYRKSSYRAGNDSNSESKVSRALELLLDEITFFIPGARNDCAGSTGPHCLSLELTPPSSGQSRFSLSAEYHLPLMVLQSEPYLIRASTNARVEESFVAENAINIRDDLVDE